MNVPFNKFIASILDILNINKEIHYDKFNKPSNLKLKKRLIEAMEIEDDVQINYHKIYSYRACRCLPPERSEYQLICFILYNIYLIDKEDNILIRNENALKVLEYCVDISKLKYDLNKYNDFYKDKKLLEKTFLKVIKYSKDNFKDIQEKFNIEKKKKCVDSFEKIKDSLNEDFLLNSTKTYDDLTKVYGRFDIQIINNLIPNCTINKDIKSNTSKIYTIVEAVDKLRKTSSPHALIIGDGGMGKTVSLLNLWKEYLSRKAVNIDTPIPMFLALNEFNQIHKDVPEQSISKLIIKQISNYYYKKSNIDNDEITILDFIKDVDSNKNYRVILFLDGLNEVSTKVCDYLIQEIKDLVDNTKGIQIIISARQDIRNNYMLQPFNKLELQNLDDSTVEKYSKIHKNISNFNLFELLKNPMMLTLYIKSNYDKISYTGDIFKYISNITKPGELLWNFNGSMLLKKYKVIKSRSITLYYKFILMHIIPYIGYEMLENEIYFFSYIQLKESIDKAFDIFQVDDFLNTFPIFNEIEEERFSSDLDERIKRYRFIEILKIISNEFSIIIENDGNYSFRHQNLRDFYASIHIANDIKVSLVTKSIPKTLTKNITSDDVIKYTTEILGEHKNIPIFKDDIWNVNNNSILEKLLCVFKNVFNNEVRYIIYNIIEMIKHSRKELTGLDLSNLDLSDVMLNGVLCSRWTRNEYFSVVLEGSLLTTKNLFPQGHLGTITSAKYNRNGSKLLSTSNDGTIKEWSTITGKCLCTYSKHNSPISDANYSQDESRIISSSYNGEVKEWIVEKLECINNLTLSNCSIRCIQYIDNETIIIGCDNGIIKEWSIDSKIDIHDYIGHNGPIMSISYSKEKRRILSSSADGTIKEWSIDSKKCINTYYGHSNIINTAIYSKNSKNILSASADGMVKEWEIGNANCIFTYIEDLNSIRSAVYSRDEKHILISNQNGIIREFDRLSHTCNKTYFVNSDRVRDSKYSPDNKKIVVVMSDDSSINEISTITGELIKEYSGCSPTVYNIVSSRKDSSFLTISFDNTILEWDTKNLKCIHSYYGHIDTIISVDYSHNGKFIFSLSKDNTLKIWDRNNGECISTFSFKEAVVSTDYCPKTKKICCGFKNGDILETESTNSKKFKFITNISIEIISIEYSKNGDKILSHAKDNSIKEIDLTSGEIINIYKPKKSEFIVSCKYSPDNKNILCATNNGNIIEFLINTSELLTYKSHLGFIKNINYSHDGKEFLTYSYDGSIKRWCTKTRTLLGVYSDNDIDITSADYNFDKTKIISSLENGKINIWSIESGEIEYSTDFIPGLYLQGTTITNLHTKSDISENIKDKLANYYIN